MAAFGRTRSKMTLNPPRRQLLRWLGAPLVLGAGIVPGRALAQAEAQPACNATPAETAGPFPADGTRGWRAWREPLNVLTEPGVVRRDLRPGLGAGRASAAGVPLRFRLRLLDSAQRCRPLAGHAVYLWHCDRDGRYSMYARELRQQNYLRGVQVSDADGWLQFDSIVPGCYRGRWPHAHFSVYADVAAALDTGGRDDRLLVSQLALPAELCRQVYADEGYATSAAHFAPLRLSQDSEFGDDLARHQSVSLSRGADGVWVATLQIALDRRA